MIATIPSFCRRSIFGVIRQVLEGNAFVALGLALGGCCHTTGGIDPSTPLPPTPVAGRAPAPSAKTNAVETGGAWRSLFDGKTLEGWAVTDFAGRGDVTVEDGKIVLENGVMTGVNWTNAGVLPLMDALQNNSERLSDLLGIRHMGSR